MRLRSAARRLTTSPVGVVEKFAAKTYRAASIPALAHVTRVCAVSVKFVCPRGAIADESRKMSCAAIVEKR